MSKKNTVLSFLDEIFGEVRAYTKDDIIWFCATDIAKALGDRDANSITRTLDKEEKDTHIVSTLGGEQELTFINESGLYEIILSKKPKTEKKKEHILRFKKWITKDVIPSIRKNDGYIDKQEELSPEEIVANALIVAQKIIEEKNKKIEEQEKQIIHLGTVNELITKHSTTIEGSRNIINRIIRSISARTKKPFGIIWNEFYSKINYKLNINIKSRNRDDGKSWLDTLNETEIYEAETIARNWASKIGLNLESILSLS